MDDIRSATNDRVKRVVRLQRDSTSRREAGLTIVEGRREFERAVENGWRPVEVYVAPDVAGDAADVIVRLAERSGAPVTWVSGVAFRKMSYREGPDGLLAVGPLPGRHLDEIVLSEKPFLLVVEGVEKPGNLGALLRTADGAGVDAVIVCDPGTDLGNPNAVRASLGTVLYLPVAMASPTEAVEWLCRQGIPLVVASPNASSIYADIDLTGPVALAVGAEDAGLSCELLAAGDRAVRIPMNGRNDSLNVSVSAAVLLYEVVRQRARVGVGR